MRPEDTPLELYAKNCAIKCYNEIVAKYNATFNGAEDVIIGLFDRGDAYGRAAMESLVDGGERWIIDSLPLQESEVPKLPATLVAFKSDQFDAWESTLPLDELCALARNRDGIPVIVFNEDSTAIVIANPCQCYTIDAPGAEPRQI